MLQRLRLTPAAQAGRGTKVRSHPNGQTSRDDVGDWQNIPQAQVKTQRSRIPTPDPRRADAARDRREGYVKWDQGLEASEIATRGGDAHPQQEMFGTNTSDKVRPRTQGYKPTPTGPPQSDPQPQRLDFETPVEGSYGPCSICDEPGHVAERCKGGRRRESEDPRSHTSDKEEPPDEFCQNCNGIHPGTCPCRWCNQLGHIVTQCTARYDSKEMSQRFPKWQKKKKAPLAKYKCWKCSQHHSFKEYCPNVSYPPPRLG